MEKFLTGLGLFVARAIGAIPSPVAYPLFSFLAYIAFIADSAHRERAMENIRFVFKESMSEKEVKKTAYEAFRNIALTFSEMCAMPRIRKENIEKYIKFENIEYFKEVKKTGRGIICCTGHFGNWEIMPHAWSLISKPAHIVARPLDNKVLDNIISYFRTYTGNSVIDKKNALRPIMKVVSGGGVIGTLHDQNVKRREGIFVDFFGREACTSFAPAIISLRTGTPIIPAYIIRTGYNRFTMRVEKPIIPDAENERDEEIFNITQKLTKSLESVIREYPGQWFWVHRRWKTKPKKDETAESRRKRKPGKKKSVK